MPTKFRSQALFFFACLAVQTTDLGAAELRSLEEVSSREQSPSMTLYVLQRCSAVFFAVASRASESGRDDVDEVVRLSNERSLMFIEVALHHAAKQGLNADASGVAIQVAEMAALYAEGMQDNYLATGNATEGTAGLDLGYCARLLQ